MVCKMLKMGRRSEASARGTWYQWTCLCGFLRICWLGGQIQASMSVDLIASRTSCGNDTKRNACGASALK